MLSMPTYYDQADKRVRYTNDVPVVIKETMELLSTIDNHEPNRPFTVCVSDYDDPSYSIYSVKYVNGCIASHQINKPKTGAMVTLLLPDKETIIITYDDKRNPFPVINLNNKAYVITGQLGPNVYSCLYYNQRVQGCGLSSYNTKQLSLIPIGKQNRTTKLFEVKPNELYMADRKYDDITDGLHYLLSEKILTNNRRYKLNLELKTYYVEFFGTIKVYLVDDALIEGDFKAHYGFDCVDVGYFDIMQDDYTLDYDGELYHILYINGSNCYVNKPLKRN